MIAVAMAVVDDGMHHQHEDLTGNVLTSLNHNYDRYSESDETWYSSWAGSQDSTRFS